MTIDRYNLVSFHNPHLTEIDFKSPLFVGNGEFSFVVDPTGMQSFYDQYKEADVPLCTMSQWYWHSFPFTEKRECNLNDLEMTEYSFNNRFVKYPVKKTKKNSAVYDYLRKNPHRANLARIGLKFVDREFNKDDISNISQKLNLYDGCIESDYYLKGVPCKATTSVDSETDSILLKIKSELLSRRIDNSSSCKKIEVCISLPYADPDISGSNWSDNCSDYIKLIRKEPDFLEIQHILDNTIVTIKVFSETPVEFEINKKKIFIKNAIETKSAFYSGQIDPDILKLRILFEKELTNGSLQKSKQDEGSIADKTPIDFYFKRTKAWWNDFWEKSGAVYLRKSRDKRAVELERRIVLSLYSLAVNCAGSIPPQETGLFCNSWYGKFHLEMHLWHGLAFPLWSQSRLLERSFEWYEIHLADAKKNAESNGYKGARWPKMVGDTGVDSPSPIAPLLVWQEPHIIYLLETVYRYGKKTSGFLEKYWNIVSETADFMADFVVFNDKNEKYELISPLIPVQEVYEPETVKNPSFEVSYWKIGLETAVLWANRLDKKVNSKWIDVAKSISSPSISYLTKAKENICLKKAVYISHQSCPETFELFTHDHPSMLFNYSYFVDTRIDGRIMKNTLDEVLSSWNYESLWGWDFAAMAMVAIRLNNPEKAIDLLLAEKPKNTYEKNGCNFQKTRNDLPAYFPGNGALLIAVAMMTAGFNGCEKQTPGFPCGEDWHIEFENINPLWS